MASRETPKESNPKLVTLANNENLKFGVCKSKQKGFSDLPLFKTDNQFNLF